MEGKDPLGILGKPEQKSSDPLGILDGGEKKKSSPSAYLSESGTSVSTDGASVQSSLPNINTDINAGALQQQEPLSTFVNTPSITVSQGEINLPTATTYATTKEVNAPGTSLTESAKALQSGVANLAAIAARTPAYTADFVNRTINTINPLPESSGTMLRTDLAEQPNALAENFEQIAKDASAASNKDYTDENGNVIGAWDYLKNGEIKKGLGKLSNNVIEALPVSAGIIAASTAGVPQAGIATGGALAFGAQEKQNLLEKNEQNKKEGKPVMSDEAINTVSLISGTLEGTIDAAFGNVKFGEFYKNLVKKEGIDAAKKAIEPTIKEVIKKGLGRYGATVAEEAAAEGANQYLDNLNHIYVGGDAETKPWDNVMESVLTGAGSAGMFGAPTLPQTALHAATAASDQKIAQKRKEQADNLKSVIDSPLASESTKAAAQEALSRNQEEDSKHAQELLAKHERLSDAKKTEINNLLYQQGKALEAAQDPMLTEEQRDSFKADADLANKQVEDIYKEADKQEQLDKKLTENFDEAEHNESHKDALQKFKDKLKQEAETKKQKENAIQEPSTSSILQHPQEGVGETGGEREGVEPSQQGEKPTEEGEQEKEVEHLIVAHAPTETTEANVTSSVSKEPLSKKGEKIAEKVGEQAKEHGVENIITDTETTRNKQTAEKAAEISGAKVEEVKDLHTWDKGDFDGVESKEWKKASKYFLEHPDQTEYEGKKLGESFNEFKDRYLEAKDKALKEADGKTLFVASSTAIKLEQALEAANGIWGKKAIEHFLDNSIEHEGDIEENPSGTEKNTEKEAVLKKLDDDFTIAQSYPLDKIDTKKKKIDAVLKRLKEQHEAGIIGKREYNRYNNLFIDLKKDAEKAFKEKRKEDNRKAANDIAEKILNPIGNKKVIKNGPDVEKAVRLLMRYGADAVTAAQNTIDDTSEAIESALEYVKSLPLYKSLNSSNNLPKDFDKQFKDAFKNPPKDEVKGEADIYEGKNERSISKRIKETSKFKEVAEKIKEKSYSYDVVNQKKAASVANDIISKHEKENSLVDLADSLIQGTSDIPYQIQGVIAAKLSDKLNVIAEKENNQFTKENTFDKAAELVMWWAEESTKAGQFNGVAAREISNSLPSSKEGLRTFANKEFDKLQDKILSKEEKKQIDKVAKEVNDLLSEDDLSEKDLAMLEKLVDKKIAEISESINGKDFVVKLNKLDSLLMDLSEC